MHLLEYNNNPNASPEERLQSLKESAQRALEELETNFDESVKTIQELTKKLSDSQDKSNQAINAEILKLTGNMKEFTKLLEILAKDPEEGKSDDGIWVWRKWKNGWAECWGMATGKANNYNMVNGFAAYYGELTFPFSFVELPKQNYNVQIGSGFALPGSASMGKTLTGTRWYALATVTGEQQFEVDIHVAGWWKGDTDASAALGRAILGKAILAQS